MITCESECYGYTFSPSSPLNPLFFLCPRDERYTARRHPNRPSLPHLKQHQITCVILITISYTLCLIFTCRFHGQNIAKLMAEPRNRSRRIHTSILQVSHVIFRLACNILCEHSQYFYGARIVQRLTIWECNTLLNPVYKAWRGIPSNHPPLFEKYHPSHAPQIFTASHVSTTVGATYPRSTRLPQGCTQRTRDQEQRHI
jgi:hypothetical protein